VNECGGMSLCLYIIMWLGRGISMKGGMRLPTYLCLKRMSVNAVSMAECVRTGLVEFIHI
jgi:hypothetical protein